MRSVLASLTCIWAFTGALLAADEPISLRYKFVEGQVIRYSVAMQDDYDITVALANDKPSTSQESGKQFRVIKVHSDGSADLELMLEWVKMSVTSSGQTISFDSRKQEKDIDPSFGPVADMLGKPHVRVTAATNGQLSNVQLLIGDKDQPNEISKGALDAFVTLPSEPVAVGTSWREDFTVPVPVTEKLSKSIKLQRRFYLQSADNGQAVITFETKILSPVNDPDEEIQLIRRPTKGTLVLDLDRGVMLEKTTTLDNTVVNFGGVASTMTLKQNHKEKIVAEQIASSDASSPK